MMATLFQGYAPDDAAIITTGLHHALEPGDHDGYLVSFRRGIEPEAGLAQLGRSISGMYNFAFSRAQRGDVRAIGKMRGLGWALLALIATLLAASVFHALLVRARRNRQPFAVLH